MKHWLIRGFSEEESKEIISKIQSVNGKKSASRPIEEIKKCSVRCIEHWIDKGLTEKEAKDKVKDIQATFSLDKCIKRHGEEGLKVFTDRQERWQVTLNSKSQCEIDEINKRKDSSSIDWALKKCNGNMEEAIKLRNSILPKKDSSSIDWALKKCNGNMEEAIKFRQDKIDKIHSTDIGYIMSSYGISNEEAVEFQQKRLKNKNRFMDEKYISYSKESVKFFQPIINHIEDNYDDLKLFYGWNINKEFFIRNSTNIYFYDFTILGLKIIIEYNGVRFHAKEGDINWKSPFGVTYEQSLEKDKIKNKLVEDNGFELIIVWSDSNLNVEQQNIMRKIDEKYRNYITTIV
jgi:very-short-patch-repair endonuclease